MSAIVVVTTSKPFDRLALIQALGSKEKVYRDNLYYFNEDLWSGLLLVDDRTFLIGSEESLVRLFEMSRQKDRTGPLEAPLVEAGARFARVERNWSMFCYNTSSALHRPRRLMEMVRLKCPWR